MLKSGIILCLLLSAVLIVLPEDMLSQELNATVTVNSDRIQSPNKNIFTTLQNAVLRLVNETKWTNAEFARNEKIDCNISLSISEQPSDDSFRAELFISARRPVYNASYITPILSYRDKTVEFDYTENQPLILNQAGIDNNLVAIIAFYCNLILAEDFDSFSLLGGGQCLHQAQEIAMQAQSMEWSGWSAFDDNRSRSSIINAFLDESLKPVRELWYTYHRRGLDEMAANADRGRTTIIGALSVLKEARKARNSEIVLQMFADSKLDEIVLIAEKASQEDRKALYDLLRSVFPGSSSKLEPLTK
jgi:hypothetical protein